MVLDKIRFNNTTYYNCINILETYPQYFTNCTNSRDIVRKNKINDCDYKYAIKCRDGSWNFDTTELSRKANTFVTCKWFKKFLRERKKTTNNSDSDSDNNSDDAITHSNYESDNSNNSDDCDGYDSNNSSNHDSEYNSFRKERSKLLIELEIKMMEIEKQKAEIEKYKTEILQCKHTFLEEKNQLLVKLEKEKQKNDKYCMEIEIEKYKAELENQKHINKISSLETKIQIMELERKLELKNRI